MSLNFPLLLVIAVFICGLLGLIDLLFLAPRRRAAIANYQGSVSQPEMAVVERLNKEPLLVEYGKSFFRCCSSCWCCVHSWSSHSRSLRDR